jgi:hypothetical protein
MKERKDSPRHHVTWRMAFVPLGGWPVSIGSSVGKISRSTFRRRASSFTSSITGSDPYLPVPTTRRWHFQGISYASIKASARLRDDTPRSIVLFLIQPWAGCEVEFVQDSSKLADRHIVAQSVDFVALKDVGRVWIIVRPYVSQALENHCGALWGTAPLARRLLLIFCFHAPRSFCIGIRVSPVFARMRGSELGIMTEDQRFLKIVDARSDGTVDAVTLSRE